jgi:hypothetical protein
MYQVERQLPAKRTGQPRAKSQGRSAGRRERGPLGRAGGKERRVLVNTQPFVFITKTRHPAHTSQTLCQRRARFQPARGNSPGPDRQDACPTLSGNSARDIAIVVETFRVHICSASTTKGGRGRQGAANICLVTAPAARGRSASSDRPARSFGSRPGWLRPGPAAKGPARWGRLG